jgi:hypothetical protein
MPLRECQNKHIYNGDKYGDKCPVCGLISRKDKETGKTPEEIAAELKVPENEYVCGWLVCIDGVNKGRSYPIHSGKNFVGSGDDMDVQILGDEKVDRYRHAILAFDDKTQKTTLLPGESAGLAYLDGKSVYAPAPLNIKAVIEIGGSKFMYVPFCDDAYHWSK